MLVFRAYSCSRRLFVGFMFCFEFFFVVSFFFTKLIRYSFASSDVLYTIAQKTVDTLSFNDILGFHSS